MSELVIRHPFDRFDRDDLGESTRKAFTPDEELVVYGVDPGGSTELSSGVDAPVRTAPTLYFKRPIPAGSAHDEWTVRGRRYMQDGEVATWVSPRTSRTVGSVVRLERRTG